MDRIVQEARDRLIAGLAPRLIVMFGSRARGNADPGSDLDLLVEADVEGTIAERMVLAHRLIEGLGVPVDVLVFTSEEVERYREWPGHIVRIALREGVVLHGTQ
jgi:predicted nucleotidyltransferase